MRKSRSIRKFKTIARALCPVIQIMMADAADAQTPANIDLSSTGEYQFVICDGYGYPNDKIDGITRVTAGYFEPMIVIDGQADPFKSSGFGFYSGNIDHCDRAIDNPALRPYQNLRRSNLLLARAGHRLTTENFAPWQDKAEFRKIVESALHDLDLAESEGTKANSATFERSVKFGIQMFRAYALGMIDRRGEALEILDRAKEIRPFSWNWQMAVALDAYFVTGKEEEYFNRINLASNVFPQARYILFNHAMNKGDFRQAISWGSLIEIPTPKAQNGVFRLERYREAVFESELQRLQLGGMLAFAYAANDQTDQSDEIINKIAEDYDSTEKLQENSQKFGYDEKTRREVVHENLARLRSELYRERSIIDLIRVARSGDLKKFSSAALSSEIPHDGRGKYLIGIMKETTKDHASEIEALQKENISEVKLFPSSIGQRLTDLYKLIPPALEGSRNVKYKSNNNFLSDEMGDAIMTKRYGELISISYGRVMAAQDALDELALMKASEETIKNGNQYFAIITRDTRQQIIYQKSTYSIDRYKYAGMSTELVIIPCGAKGPPPPYEKFSKLIVDAGKVRSSLFPIYSSLYNTPE